MPVVNTTLSVLTINTFQSEGSRNHVLDPGRRRINESDEDLSRERTQYLDRPMTENTEDWRIGFFGFFGFFGFQAFALHEPLWLFFFGFFGYFSYFRYYRDELKYLGLLGVVGVLVAIAGVAGLFPV